MNKWRGYNVTSNIWVTAWEKERKTVVTLLGCLYGDDLKLPNPDLNIHSTYRK